MSYFLHLFHFQDILQNGFNLDLSEQKALWISKGLAVGYGVVCFGFIYVAKYMPGVLEV